MRIHSYILERTDTNVTLHVRQDISWKPGGSPQLNFIVSIDTITGDTLILFQGQIGKTSIDSEENQLDNDEKCEAFAIYASIEYLGILQKKEEREDE